MCRRFILCLFSVFVIVPNAFGQIAGNSDNWCREGFFTRETKDFGVGFVKPKQGNKTYFHNDDQKNCPDAAACKSKSFVVAGDGIITNKTRGNYVCGWFTGSTGKVTVGWLKKADLDFPLMVHDASERVWVGEWQYGENSISMTPNKLSGFLNVKGVALWKGLGDNVHVGELDAKSPYKDGVLEYSDGDSEFDCRATMTLQTERYLVVADNGNCGGANVTFSGIYRKISSTRAK